MKRLCRISIWLFVLLLFATPPGAQEQPAVYLTFIHVNDFHGHLLSTIDKSISDTRPVGGAARLARMIEDERARNPEGTLLLSAGDMFQGTSISNLFRGQSVMAVMNYLKFDAMAIGNHEFDWGQAILNQLAESAGFPFLAANIQDTQHKNPVWAKPFVVLEKRRLKIAVVGLTTPETPYSTKPDNVSGFTFQEPEQALPQLIRELRSSGADLVVLLSHSGLDADRKIAESVSGIDVIVGGHSHTAVAHPLRIGETIIVQAGSNGAYLGVLQLKVDSSTRKVIDYTRENELRTAFADPDNPVDSSVAEIVDRFNNQVKAEFAREVGETSVDLKRSSREESNVGNLICDALRESSGADIAVHNSGGIRTDIPKGKITLEQVYSLLPFDNNLIVMDLTGDQVKQILEQNTSPEHKILQISGMTVQYDLSRPPGARVIGAQIANKPLDPGKTYRVATNDFLAAGGDQYSTFKNGKNIVSGDLLRDVFAGYLSRHSPVHPEIEKRIVFVSQ
jgi:2',3'-cyclic-nucleotide 2'-phosphodiesterase (5'-nucleotidase family)